MCAEQMQHGELEKPARFLYEYLSLYVKPRKADLVPVQSTSLYNVELLDNLKINTS